MLQTGVQVILSDIWLCHIVIYSQGIGDTYIPGGQIVAFEQNLSAAAFLIAGEFCSVASRNVARMFLMSEHGRSTLI